MPQILGCATTYSIVIHEEISGPDCDGTAAFGRPVAAIDKYSNLKWDRRLDETSEAVIVVPMSAECCKADGFMKDVHSWHHGVSIYRDGQLVWDGPIVQIKYTMDAVTITARDITALLAKRVLPRDLCFSAEEQVCVAGPTGVSFGGPKSPEFVVKTLIEEALTIDGHGGFVTMLGESDFEYQAYFKQYDGPVYDFIFKIASNYVNFTALGRRIIVSVGGLTDGTGIARTAALTCADFQADGFSLVEDGLSALTWDVQYADDVVVDGVVVAEESVGIATAWTPQDSQEADCYYGLLQGIQDGNSVLATAGASSIVTAGDALAQAAKNILAGAYPPPLIMSPEGAVLQPNAPVTMEELVPGTLVPVIFDCLCIEVGQTFLLTKLEVEFTSEGETVIPTFISLGSDNQIDTSLY